MITIGEEHRIELSEQADNAQVVFLVKHFTAELGFDEIQQSMIATAASELSTNIIRYAGKGMIILRSLLNDGRTGIEIIAEDKGPGIPHIERAFTDHYTTGESLGLGLPSVQRIMDEIDVESKPDKGTIISIRKWR